MVYIELCLYIIIIGIIFSREPVYKLFFRVSKVLRFSLLFFLILLLTAQVLEKHIYTYPLVHWGMYSSSNPSTDYRTFEIELQNGITKHYPFEEVSLTAPGAFMGKFKDLEWRSRRYKKDYVQLAVQDLIAIYEMHHTGEHIQRFIITEIKLHGDSAGSGYFSAKSRIFEYERP